MTTYHCEQAWLPTGITRDVLITVGADGKITDITRAHAAASPAQGSGDHGTVAIHGPADTTSARRTPGDDSSPATTPNHPQAYPQPQADPSLSSPPTDRLAKGRPPGEGRGLPGGGISAPAEALRGLPAGVVSLRGLVFPGFANAHSHAFHRALRGRTHGDGGTFWTWRERMYALAAKLDPDSYLALARAAYAEMALAGVTCVGEFHYLHHAPGGRRYADPNAMGAALIQAAKDAGIRLTLLDTCYLAGGIGAPVSDEQLRFSDGTAQAWAGRVADLKADATTRVGGAIHSVRAVPRDALSEVAQGCAGPLHVHLSEQPAENEACQAAYGRTPTELLADADVLGPRTTAVHATHLTAGDIALLGGSGTGACFCPTTEGDLADGLGPARELLAAGSPLSLGSDQHAVVDPLVEARALEHGERFRTGQRGRLSPDDLLAAMTTAGHAALGWSEAGRLEVGAPADFVAVRLDSPRTAGCLPGQAMFAATASDVDTVVVGGRVVVRDGAHMLGDVGTLLTEAIEGLWA